MSFLNLDRDNVASKGGQGSGNFGHEGRPGERGGSGEGSGGDSESPYERKPTTNVGGESGLGADRYSARGDRPLLAGQGVGPTPREAAHRRLAEDGLKNIRSTNSVHISAVGDRGGAAELAVRNYNSTLENFKGSRTLANEAKFVAARNKLKDILLSPRKG